MCFGEHTAANKGLDLVLVDVVFLGGDRGPASGKQGGRGVNSISSGGYAIV